MRQFSILHKALSYIVMALLLFLPLAAITADPLFTAYEDASPEVSLSADDRGTTEDHYLRTDPELSFSVEPAPTEHLNFPSDRLRSTLKPALTVLSPKDIIAEIFHPPQAIS